MRTRNSNFPNNSNVTIPRRRNRGRAPKVVNPELRTIVEVAPMAERTMEELLRAPTEGYGEAIVLPEINADHFEIKTNLLQLVQASPFHDHINSFKRITSTLRFRDVPNDVIKLTMFPYSLEGATKVWYEKELPNSILTWEDLESVSKTDERIDKLADQISTLVEIVSKKVVTPAPVKAVEEICVTCSGPHAWYNCPNTDNNQSSVCAATGTYNQVNPPNRVSNQMAPPGFAPVQNNGQNRYNQNQGQGNNFNRGNNFHGNQGFQAQNNHAPNFQNQGFQNQPFQVPNNQVQQEFSNEFSSYKRSNDQMMRNMQNQINSLKGEFKNEIQNTMKTQQTVLMNQQNAFQNNLQNMISGFFQNQASTSGTLPSNTIPNPKGEMKAITTRSGVAYEGPSIPTNPSPKKVVERETEETTDTEQTNFQGSTAHIPPPVNPIPIPEPDVPKTLPKPSIPYPSRRNDQKSRDKASNQMEKIFQIFQDLRFDISFADALLLMPRFAPTIRNLLMNKEKLLELAKIPLNENCSAMLLKKLPEKLGDPGKFLIPCDFSGMDHPQKHANESIKMVNDTCEDSLKETNNLSSGSTTPISDFHPSLEFFETRKSLLERFIDEPALVCLPPPEDDDDEKEKHEVKNIAELTAKRQTRITPCLKNFKVIHKESIFHLNKTPQISLVFAITSALLTIKPKDSLIMGDEHLSTFRVEEIIPIPRESVDTFDNNKGCDLTFCDNNMIFSNPLFGSKDNLTSRDDESFLKEDVQEENF
ncbi:hypothetical protein Tco_0621820 [Tanacetum coccineum]